MEARNEFKEGGVVSRSRCKAGKPNDVEAAIAPSAWDGWNWP